jgi:hypothetical protein
MWTPSICTTRISRPLGSEAIQSFMRAADSATCHGHRLFPDCVGAAMTVAVELMTLPLLIPILA